MITNTTKRFWVILGFVFYHLIKNPKGRKWLFIPLLILGIGFAIPQNMIIPVDGASPADWDKNSFWAYPWGTSITHKGIDIFKERGKDVVSSTHGMVIYTSEGGKGGNAVMVLGPKWRFHYYAHLDAIKTFSFKPVKRGEALGTVGDSGNAKGKPTHLHYSITTPFPYIQRYDKVSVQGWKKMFYLSPDEYLRK